MLLCRIRTYDDLPMTSSDDLPGSYRRLVGAEDHRTRFRCQLSRRILPGSKLSKWSIFTIVLKEMFLYVHVTSLSVSFSNVNEVSKRVSKEHVWRLSNP